MKILVTGASGFLASHVADALSDAGHDVMVLDRVTSPWLRPDQTMLIGDVQDAEAMAKAAQGCDAIYHFAAVADIGEAMGNPRDTVQVNILGTLNMLEAARLAGVKRFVFSSSIYVYSAQGSFYRTSKQACEHLIYDYQERYGLDYTVLRFGSLYGPRADSNNAVHRMLGEALTKRRISYGGNGQEVREYIHVLDAAAMSVDVLDDSFVNQIVHLTGRERMTTGQMIEMINEILGGQLDIQLGRDGIAGHYMQTPYNYTPKLGRRLNRNTYIDLGLGLLDCIQHIDRELRSEEDIPFIEAGQ